MALVLLRRLEKLRTMLGEQRLVRGDDVLAALQRLLDEVEGFCRAADQLDDDIKLGIRDQLTPIDRGEISGTPISRARSARRTATWSTRISVPVRCRSRSFCDTRRRQTLAPTVPRPARPTRRIGQDVLTETLTLAEVFRGSQRKGSFAQRTAEFEKTEYGREGGKESGLTEPTELPRRRRKPF